MNTKQLIQPRHEVIYALTFVFFCCAPWSNAMSRPIFSIIPTTPNHTTTSTFSNTSVVYDVINNTPNPRTLVMEPITGISQNTTAPGACTYPFTLAANGGRCQLILDIIGSQLNTNVVGGPIICSTLNTHSNAPTPFLCAQPSQVNTLTTTLSVPYSYITNLGIVPAENGGTVTQCNVNPYTGLFSQCADTGIPGTPNQVPEDVVFIAGGTMAYVIYTDYTAGSAGTIKACNGDQNGNLSACFDTSATPLSRPQALTLNASGNRAYIADAPPGIIVGAAGYLLQCTVDQSTYDLTNCITVTPNTVYKPQDIILNAANTLAYIANGEGSSVDVTKCAIDANTGALDACVDSGADLGPDCGGSANETIVFNAGQTLAYITCTNGFVKKCSINANTGELSACADSGADHLVYPIGLVFNSANTLAYIANHNSLSVTMCHIDSNNGDLSQCVNAAASELPRPVGIALH